MHTWMLNLAHTHSLSRPIVITKRAGVSSLDQLTTECYKFSRLTLYTTQATRLPAGLHLADRAAKNKLDGIDSPNTHGIHAA